MRRNSILAGFFWSVVGIICLYLNFRYGAAILRAIPGIVSGQNIYMSQTDANMTEIVFMAFEFLLALGFVNPADGLSPWEIALLICGTGSSLIDIWSNTVPWVVGNTQSGVLLKVYGANLSRLIKTGNVWEIIIFILVCLFGIVVGIGGEIALAQAYRSFFPTTSSH